MVLLATGLATAAAFPDKQRPVQQAAAPGAEPDFAAAGGPAPVTAAPATALPSRIQTINAFAGRTPRYWGLEAPGARTRLPTGTPGIAVTVDFCGGPGGSGFDQGLLTVLGDRHVPATLFLNSRWIAANAAPARQLAADPLFNLANHGTTHRPVSTNGKSAYGIQGTLNTGEVYDEVMTNDATLTQLTGKRARFFRGGTAYLDDVACDIVTSLGLVPTGFSINADGGATYPAATVAKEASVARPGDIVICHGNHPGSGTAEGMKRALDTLAGRGTPFVPLT